MVKLSVVGDPSEEEGTWMGTAYPNETHNHNDHLPFSDVQLQVRVGGSWKVTVLESSWPYIIYQSVIT